MKVICVQGFDPNSTTGGGTSEWIPIVGSTYKAIDTYYFMGVTYYKLEECPYGYGFDVRNFATASDIDETELLAERETHKTEMV